MIPKFGVKDGASFKGLALYLTHDAGHARTDNRVAWTHTLNLAHDHIPSAVNEMFRTYDDAELLKAELGVKVGTRVARPVKHVSLNWHRSEAPDKAEMIRAAESFLERMGWQDQQCILVCHTDRPHPHVHLAISAIDPATGRKIDDAFERSRAQNWALAYEQAQGKVLCPQRLVAPAERKAAPPRPVWLMLERAMQAELRAETARLAEAPDVRDTRLEVERLEWQVLKELQKEERLAFMADGRAAYRAARDDVYRAVRREFRQEWSAYHQLRRDGADRETLAHLKADLVARQNEALDARREAACALLRQERDIAYRVLLDAQKEMRSHLLDRQGKDLRSTELLHGLAEDRRSEGNQALASTVPAPLPANGNRPEPWSGGWKIHPLAWSANAGMAAQNASAMRWLDRVAERMQQEPSADFPDPRQAALDRIYDRAHKVAAVRGIAREAKGIEPEPD